MVTGDGGGGDAQSNRGDRHHDEHLEERQGDRPDGSMGVQVDIDRSVLADAGECRYHPPVVLGR